VKEGHRKKVYSDASNGEKKTRSSPQISVLADPCWIKQKQFGASTVRNYSKGFKTAQKLRTGKSGSPKRKIEGQPGDRR